MTRRRRLPPRPPDPPAGMMWWHGELMTIAAVERMAKVIIERHDDHPRARRDRDNGIMRHFGLSNEKPDDFA